MSDRTIHTEQGPVVQHVFPLRPDFMLEVQLPTDFNTKDVQRLNYWLSAIAFTEVELDDD